MARDSDAKKIEKWGRTGDRTEPETESMTRAAGWTALFAPGGGLFPFRRVFNQIWSEVTGMLSEINERGGTLEWDADLDYVQHARVMGSNGNIYRAVVANGPDASNATNPVTRANDDVWADSTGGIADDGVTTAKIADGAVTTDKLASDAIQLADGAVGTDKLATDAVTGAKIDDGAVGTDQLAADAVTGAKIGDGAVGTDQLAADAVTSAKIGDGAVGTDQLAADAVTGAKIGDGAVGTDQLAADAVTGAKIGDDAIGTDHLADNITLPDGVKAPTLVSTDNSTKVATTAFVQSAVQEGSGLADLIDVRFRTTNSSTAPSINAAATGWSETSNGATFSNRYLWMVLRIGSPGWNTLTPMLIGYLGEDGDDGATGSQGEDGDDGATGSQGPRGATGSRGPQGEDGDDGATGSQGPQGATGSRGPQGEDGDDGATGSQGPQGATGSRGPRGFTGTTGFTGPRGPAGEDGEDGSDATADGVVTGISASTSTVNAGEDNAIRVTLTLSRSGGLGSLTKSFNC